MRLFVAIDLEDAIRQRIIRFMDGVRGFAPAARWVKPESLHVTLKFIGEMPLESLHAVKRELEAVRAHPTSIKFAGWGFFPNPKAARVFWVGMRADPNLEKLASAVASALSKLRVPLEERRYQPHLTLARGGGRSGAPGRLKSDRRNADFEKLQAKLAGLPAAEFGSMTACEFFLYHSQLSPAGSRYTKLESFALAP